MPNLVPWPQDQDREGTQWVSDNMGLPEINPIQFAVDHPGYSAITALALLQGNPRLANALIRTGVYWFTQQFRDMGNVGRIFYQELKKPTGQVKPIISRESAKIAFRNKVAPTAKKGLGLASRAIKNPIIIGTTIGVAAATAGMVKQNPPPQIAFMGGPLGGPV